MNVYYGQLQIILKSMSVFRLSDKSFNVGTCETGLMSHKKKKTVKKQFSMLHWENRSSSVGFHRGNPR